MEQALEVCFPLYRSLDHAAARKVFAQARSWGEGHEAVAEFGRVFVELQSARMLADHEPKYLLGNRGDVLELLAGAHEAVATSRSLPKDEKLFLAVQLLRKHR